MPSPAEDRICSNKMKKSVFFGVLVALAVVGWHIYEYLLKGKGGTEPGELPIEHELHELTQKLYEDEQVHNPYLAHVDFQHRTRTSNRDDQAPRPLLQLNQAVLATDSSSTAYHLKQLFDNYQLDTATVEQVTPAEEQEQLNFLRAVLQTPVMRRTMKFLAAKGLVQDNYDSQLRLLKEIWFTPYSRGQGRVGSSGFEHVFLAELKDQSVLGLHNWLYFSEQEEKGNLDYKGFIERLDFGKGQQHLAAVRFTFHNIVKPYNTLFIGTSPELEMSLYTLCFLVKLEDEACPVQLGSAKFSIVTHTWNWHGKKLLATAYPSIDKS